MRHGNRRKEKKKKGVIDTQLSRIAYLMQCLGIPVILSTFACRVFDISNRFGVEIFLVYFPFICLLFSLYSERSPLCNANS